MGEIVWVLGFTVYQKKRRRENQGKTYEIGEIILLFGFVAETTGTRKPPRDFIFGSFICEAKGWYLFAMILKKRGPLSCPRTLASPFVSSVNLPTNACNVASSPSVRVASKSPTEYLLEP
jgi:hypothetical protein